MSLHNGNHFGKTGPHTPLKVAKEHGVCKCGGELEIVGGGEDYIVTQCVECCIVLYPEPMSIGKQEHAISDSNSSNLFSNWNGYDYWAWAMYSALSHNLA